MHDQSTLKLAAVDNLCQWADLPFDRSRQRTLAKLLPSFQDRARRLDQINVDGVEYAFQQSVVTE